METVKGSQPKIKFLKRKAETSEENYAQICNTKLKDVCHYKFCGHSAERKGERDEMQDAHVIIDDFLRCCPSSHRSVQQMAFYAVFDGHGGMRASSCAAATLHENLASKLPEGDLATIEKDIKRAFFESFKKTDEEFLKEASKNKPIWKDGSTAVCVFVLNDSLYIANLGDSKAVLCRVNSNKPSAIPLTQDHSPTQYNERIRIEKSGGYVKDGRVMGVLEVSRSIGDGQYKTCGVSCIPDVKRCKLSDNDRFLVIACDGLWKVFKPVEAVETVMETLEQSVEAAVDKTAEEESYNLACNKLAAEAVRRGCGDNVTVIIVSITAR